MNTDQPKIRPALVPLYFSERSQTSDGYTVEIKVPEGFDKSLVKLNKYTKKNGIELIMEGEIPFICGVLYAPFTINRVDEKDSIKLIIHKTEPGNWDILVKGPLMKKRMDPQSLFEMYTWGTQNNKEDIARNSFNQACQTMFPPAIYSFIGLSADAGRFMEDGAPLAMELMDSYKDSHIAVFCGQMAVNGKVPPTEAIKFLRKGVGMGDSECNILLGIIYSPLEPPHGSFEDPKLAFEAFSKVREIPLAAYGLGQLYFHGIGCEKDEKLGRELIDIGHKAHPELEPLQESSIPSTTPSLPPIPAPHEASPLPIPPKLKESLKSMKPALQPETKQGKIEEEKNANKVAIIGTVAAVLGLAGFAAYKLFKGRKMQ